MVLPEPLMQNNAGSLRSTASSFLLQLFYHCRIFTISFVVFLWVYSLCKWIALSEPVLPAALLQDAFSLSLWCLWHIPFTYYFGYAINWRSIFYLLLPMCFLKIITSTIVHLFETTFKTFLTETLFIFCSMVVHGSYKEFLWGNGPIALYWCLKKSANENCMIYYFALHNK